MSNESQSTSLVPADMPQLPQIKGPSGTVKRTEEESLESETHKEVTKKEGNKEILQKGRQQQKEDHTKSAEASLKTFTDKDGVKRTVATTSFSTSSSYEMEEHFEETTKSAGPVVKSIKEK